MYTTPPRWLSLSVSILGLGILSVLATREQVDPLWVQAGELVRTPCRLAADAQEEAKQLYAELHPSLPQAFQEELLNQGPLKSLSWEKFSDFCRQAQKSRYLVVSGVTGTGATKLAEQAAQFLTADPATQVLTVRCAPEFDLELHNKYIGYEDENRVFHPGLLLEFWERCQQQPDHYFVCLIDNFDKINPETFFGPELWERLSPSNEKAVLGGREIRIPDNFLMLSVTHLGPGSKVEFTEEHLKRLGRRYVLQPDACELLHLVDKKARKQLEQGGQVWLQDFSTRRKLVYYFIKSNELVRQKYGPGYELGQGSELRSFFQEGDLESIKHTYLTHINALRGVDPLRLADFAHIDYAVQHHGLAPQSSWLHRQVQWLSDTGYLVEITMVLATALLTALISWWIFWRREKLIRIYAAQAQEAYDAFEAQTWTAEEAAKKLESIKTEVNQLVLSRKLNYTEALYFIAFIDDKVRRVEYAMRVSDHFQELFTTFMEDDLLTEREYTKLNQVLQSIRSRIPEDTYQHFCQRVEQAYLQSKP
jgi:hypothetical protein